MPVILKSQSGGDERRTCAERLCAHPSAACLEKASKTLHIGLVNNMPDAALEATKRQFLSLLSSASESFSIQLSLHSLPGVPRSQAVTTCESQLYSSVENLWNSQLDGMIVTGREPITQNLADEPYWESFTKLVQWAQGNTYSTIWSCLAAHAAVLYVDGISRVRNGHKHSGVFDCERLAEHPLVAEGPSQFKLPHSRWNGLKEHELKTCGYQVLTRTADAGVDTFVKDGKSMFVFFQGHPEYEANALLLEYRRDIGRYVRGETNTYPIIPWNYFDRKTTAALAAVEHRAKIGPCAEIVAEASRILETAEIQDIWHSTAVGIYRNWLEIISARKKLHLQKDTPVAEARGTDEVPALAAAEAQAGIYAGPSTTLTASRNVLTIL